MSELKGVKSAEEWHHTAPYIKAQREGMQGPNWKCGCASCQHLRNVQLDAYRAGRISAFEEAAALFPGGTNFSLTKIHKAILVLATKEREK